MLEVGRAAIMGAIWGEALRRECQQPQSSRPEGWQLIKEEDDRRAKTTGGNQIKGSAGLAKGVKHFLLLVKFSPNSSRSNWDGGGWRVWGKRWGRSWRQTDRDSFQSTFASNEPPHPVVYERCPCFFLFFLFALLCLPLFAFLSPFNSLGGAVPASASAAPIWWASGHRVHKQGFFFFFFFRRPGVDARKQQHLGPRRQIHSAAPSLSPALLKAPSGRLFGAFWQRRPLRKVPDRTAAMFGSSCRHVSPRDCQNYTVPNCQPRFHCIHNGPLQSTQQRAQATITIL